MIHFLVGENWYGRDRVYKEIVGQSESVVERPDVESLGQSDLHDLLLTQSLFSQERCIVFANLSEHKLVWERLGELLEAGVSSDLTLIVIEDKPDKRTKTYKTLQKTAEVREFPLWTPRDRGYAMEWLLHEAEQRQVQLQQRDASQLIDRVGVDQALLASALEKLMLLDEITPEGIDASIELQASESVFMLLETALRGDVAQVGVSLMKLKQIEDPYRVFGLISSQVLQLAALIYGQGRDTKVVAQDIGAPPFVVVKLSTFATALTVNDAERMISTVAATDMKMKSVAIDPWVLIEACLIKLARI